MKINFINSWKANAKKQTITNVEIRFGKFTLLKLSYNTVLVYVPSEDKTPPTWLSETNKLRPFRTYEILLFNYGYIFTV